MKLKQLIGSQAYWIVNKELANNIGLDATVLLQHLIDLQEEFFKNGNFYQQQERLLETLPLKLKAFRAARKVLQDKKLITYKRGHQAKNYYTVLNENVLEVLGININSSNSDCSDSSNSDCSDSSKSTSSNSSKSNSGIPQTVRINNNNNKDTNTAYDNIYNKLIEDWPKTRIQSKGPVIKYLKTKSKEDITSILKNKSRYLKANDGYVKNIRNYLEHEDWTDTSIKEYETKPKSSTITNTKDFETNY